MNSGESNIVESAEKAGGPLFTPSLGGYGAIRMDPVAMVRHLDSKAMEEAATINPKTYLVYLMKDPGLPVPEMPWYYLEVHIIALSLRTVDEEQCITPDMCIPIFPNEIHPTGQEPLRTKPIFPFPNCYHWDDTQVHVRVHAREEGFLVDDAIMLPSSEEWRLTRTLAEFHGRAATARNARATPPAPVAAGPEHDADEGASLSAPSAEGGLPPVATTVVDGAQEICDILSFHSDFTEGLLEDTSEEAVDAIVHMNVFGNPYADVELLPLVHLWIDMPSQVKQDDIGSPADFFKDWDAIIKIIKKAHARDPYLPTLAEVVGISSDPFGIDDKSDSDGASVLSRTAQHAVELNDQANVSAPQPEPIFHRGPKSRRFRPSKMLRKLKTRLRALFIVPYIPIWP